MLSLGEVLRATQGRAHGTVQPDFPCTGVFIDSRQARKGGLFIALKGQKHDGHAFVASVMGQGAAGALVERIPQDCAWALDPGADGPPLIVVESTQRALEEMARFALAHHPHLDVVGITGSLGKTTTKEVVATTLAAHRKVVKTEGNLNSEIGLPVAVLNNLRDEHEVAVLEMGMYWPGDIRHLARLARPRIGVVTAVQPVHLERLGTIERIRAAKQELVEELPRMGVAILNADDPLVASMSSATQARVVRYGVAETADVRGENIVSHGLRGVDFDLVASGRRLRVTLPLLGAHTVHAALAAAAVALEEGFSVAEAAEALARVNPSLRLLVVDGVNGSRVIDDSYNASPESVLAALNLLVELPGRRKIAVLGDMLELGTEEEPGHRRVGVRAGHVLDWLITVGPRSLTTGAAAREAGMPPQRVIAMDNVSDVVKLLTYLLRPDDDVLVKGSRAVGLDLVVLGIRAVGEG